MLCCPVDFENGQAEFLSDLARRGIQALIDDNEAGPECPIQRSEPRPRPVGGSADTHVVRDAVARKVMAASVPFGSTVATGIPAVAPTARQRVGESLRLLPQIRISQRRPAGGKQGHCLRLRLRSSFDEAR